MPPLSLQGDDDVLRLPELRATIPAPFMTDFNSLRSVLFHGVFRLEHLPNGQKQLSRQPNPPASIPGPEGRLLHIATVDASAQAICPACATAAKGGFVSFVQDLRLAYACPSCQKLVWLNGA
jgi:hypothetical protein